MESHSLASGNREDPRRGESWQDAERSGAGFPKTRLWPYAVWAAVSDQESRPAIPAPRCPPALGRSLFFLPSRVLSGLGVLSREGRGAPAPLFRGPHNCGGHEWVNGQRHSTRPRFSPAGNAASSGAGSRSR